MDSAGNGSAWRLRQILNYEAIAGHVAQPVGPLMKEMMMKCGVGVEIGPTGFHHDFAQQPGRGHLVKCVIDGGKRDPHIRRHGFVMKKLRGDVTVAAVEQ